MLVLPLQVLLLLRVVLGLNSLLTLLPHRLTTLLLRTAISRLLAADLRCAPTLLLSDLQMLKFLVEHNRLVNDG